MIESPVLQQLKAEWTQEATREAHRKDIIGIVPKPLLDNLTLSAAKRRHFAAPTLENVGQSRSAASRSVSRRPGCHSGALAPWHALLLSFKEARRQQPTEKDSANPMTTSLKGIVHGKVIELDQEPGLPDGQEVSVTLQPISPGPGLVSSSAQVSYPGWEGKGLLSS